MKAKHRMVADCNSWYVEEGLRMVDASSLAYCPLIITFVQRLKLLPSTSFTGV